MSDSWKSRTRQVHGGTRRSQWGEVSEALFLTQGFVYDTAEAAQARFEKAGEDEYHLCPLRQPDRGDVRGAHRLAWKGPRMPLPPPAAWRRSRAR